MNIKISSKEEEFFGEYDFVFMAKGMYNIICESIVEPVIDEEVKVLVETRDNEGNILFNWWFYEDIFKKI
ncbi:hypothetical protein [Tepidimicrobium xylanilyticum]|uniref:Uncharacterized protein n=1 Tax=Tepidimicrobium xylanilyticum TaxID=1123352 RepID=A0A1H2WT47_9FIRM|nr:hypothetical protein [Tepidimicrobium xylanilyticum]GMG97958.1 hypothetical protein EN5CB1_27840 [Tepidimicrobium xylanilyticum]SDW83688.1 hypothetical protein SAMN05660923_01335 [Tepidimicrobium xylanilyticum]